MEGLADGATFYVAPDGDDNNPGTIDQPLATLKGARDRVHTVLDGCGDVTVYFRGGYYYFKETVVFGLENSGTADQVITYRNYPSENPIFTSGIHIAGWRKIRSHDPGYDEIPAPAQDHVYITDISDELEQTGLFHFLLDRNVDCLPRARSEGFSSPRKHGHNKSYTIAGYGTGVPPEEKMDLIYSEDAPIEDWPNIDDVEIRVITGVWSVNLLSVRSVDTKNRKLYTKVPATYPIWGFTDIRPYQDEAGHPTWVRPEKTIWVENTLKGLDKKSEWVVNTKTKKLYLWPKSETSKIYAPCLKELVRVEGNIDYWGPKDVPVRYLRFKGITFTNGDRDVLRKDDSGIQHDWEMEDKPTALLRFRGSEHCVVDGCTFTKSGGTGVRFDLHSQFNIVKNCYFDLLGMSGIFFCGYGPGKKDVNKHNQILHNEITRVGHTKWDSHGIIIWQSGYNRVAHNYIHHCPRKAICLSGPRPAYFNPETPTREQSWKTMRRKEMAKEDYTERRGDYEATAKYRYLNGNVVEYNTVHDVLQKLDDGSAINVTGGGTGDNFGAPNIIRLNYLYNIYGGDAMMRMDGSAHYTHFKENIFYHSKLPFGILCFRWGLFSEANLFLDVHPVNAKHYIGDPGRPLSFRGNLIFDDDFVNEEIDYSRYAYWFDDFHQIYRVLDGDYLPGKLEGVQLIKQRLAEALEHIRCYQRELYE